jgi:hypothetical protein
VFTILSYNLKKIIVTCVGNSKKNLKEIDYKFYCKFRKFGKNNHHNVASYMGERESELWYLFVDCMVFGFINNLT